MKKIKALSFILSVALVSLGAAYAVAVWSGPSATPPDGNPDSPINVSLNPQVKTAKVSAKEFLDYNDPSYYLMDETSNMKLQGKISFNSSINKGTGELLYDPTDSHANSFDPVLPDTPRTNTGLLNTTYFPF